MKNLTTCFLVITTMLLFSCKKETANTQLRSLNNEVLSVEQKIKWNGAFISYDGLQGSSFIPDKLFIRHGYARINRGSVKINQHNYYSTKFWLILPASVNIKADSINFEAGVKNPFNSSFYSPYYGRDITLYIKGESNEASITNVATDDVNPVAKERAGIKLGNTFKNYLPQLQYNFENYGTLILQTFNRGVVAYRNNEYLSGLAYEKEPLVGRLKEIGIVFKGSGYIDYIKIYNSVNGKLLISEDFNTDGQSTVIIWK